MNNIVFLVAVGGKPEYEICKQSWGHWCEKNNVRLVVLEEEVVPKEEMFINYQRYYLFKLLDAQGIEYDRVLTVDSDTIIHPDAPNFFEITSDKKMYFVNDNGSYDWILRGLEWYQKSLFKGVDVNFWEYGNSGFQLLSKKHSLFYDKMLELWDKEGERIMNISNKYGLGKEQAVWNLMIRKHNIEYELLPYKWNMTCMDKKELLNDKLFLKFGWIYHFNGIPGKETGSVSRLMEETYKELYEKN